MGEDKCGSPTPRPHTDCPLCHFFCYTYSVITAAVQLPFIILPHIFNSSTDYNPEILVFFDVFGESVPENPKQVERLGYKLSIILIIYYSVDYFID